MPKYFAPVLVLAAVLWLGGAGAAHAAAEAGEVLTFNGDCFAGSGDQRTKLKMGDPVHTGDAIEVPGGAKLKLRMADGSVLALASGTHMTIQAYDVSPGGDKRDVKLGLDNGLLRAVVSRVSQPSNFEVATATSVAAARSTDWFVEADPDRTTVAVLDGSVSFGARDSKIGVLIPAKAGSEIDTPAAELAPTAPAKPGAPAPARRLLPTPVTHWTQEQFDRLIARTSVGFGWCQCIADTTVIRAECQTSVDTCKAVCGSNQSSFIPNATQSCARFYANGVVDRGEPH